VCTAVWYCCSCLLDAFDRLGSSAHAYAVHACGCLLVGGKGEQRRGIENILMPSCHVCIGLADSVFVHVHAVAVVAR